MFSDFGYSEEKKLGKPYDLRLLMRLYPFVRSYRRHLAGAVVLVILLTLLDLAVPYVTKIAVDHYIVPRPVAAASGISEKVRYLNADMSDPGIAAVVRKYPAHFQVRGASARIRLEDVPRLDRPDLITLRQGDIRGVSLAAAVFLVIITLNFLFSFLQVIVMEYAGQRIMHDLRMTLFKHIQGLSVSFFNRTPIARLVTRTTNDIQNMHELFTSVIVVVFKDVFLLVGIAAVMLSIDWELALVCFSVIPFVVMVSLYFSRLARDVFRTLRIKTAEINTRFSETIAGIRVIQLFRQETANYRKFRTLNHEFYISGMRQIHIFALFMPLIELLNAVALALIIWYGGREVLGEEISLGVLVAFISYMRMFFRPIRDIAEKYNILQNAMASAERIFLILDSHERLPAAADSAPEKIGTITFDQVIFSYVRDETVLRNISFTVRAGETVAIVGPTGSGKTSLINLLIRFYDPVSGRVLINGQDIREWNLAALRSRMALVTQDPFLFSESIRENILQGKNGLSDAEIRRILKDSNCQGIIERLPEGMNTRLAEGGTSVSSGERQLISVARAFARDPELIILDEATSYIDSETEVRIQQALSRLMENRTSFIVAHRLSTARHADTIIVLNRGQIIESGTHDALMAQKGFYFRLNQLQH